MEVETDQQVRGQAYAFPPHEHQQVVVGQHQGEHEEHEEVQVGEESIEAAFMCHEADSVNVDEKSDARYHQHHDARQLVEIEAERYVERAGIEPVEGQSADVGLATADVRGRHQHGMQRLGKGGGGKSQGNG